MALPPINWLPGLNERTGSSWLGLGRILGRTKKGHRTPESLRMKGRPGGAELQGLLRGGRSLSPVLPTQKPPAERGKAAGVAHSISIGGRDLGVRSGSLPPSQAHPALSLPLPWTLSPTLPGLLTRQLFPWSPGLLCPFLCLLPWSRPSPALSTESSATMELF